MEDLIRAVEQQLAANGYAFKFVRLMNNSTIFVSIENIAKKWIIAEMLKKKFDCHVPVNLAKDMIILENIKFKQAPAKYHIPAPAPKKFSDFPVKERQINKEKKIIVNNDQNQLSMF